MNLCSGPCVGGLSEGVGWEGCLREHPESESAVTLLGESSQLGHWRGQPCGEGMLGLCPGWRLNQGGVGSW